MEISDIISPDRIASDMDASSKKRALEKISEIISASEGVQVLSQEVCESLIAREKLGSTGIGSGVAIPHGRLKNSDKTIAAFVQLHDGINFDAMDDEDVDLLFALLVPENSTDEHLQILAQLAEMFSKADFRAKLRASKSSDELFDLLRNWRKHCN
jgi:PTS system nitrogen regulatory IIA component